MKRTVSILLAISIAIASGCASGLDPKLAEAQTRPLYNYTKPLVDAHETDSMKKEDFEKLWAAWFANIEKAKKGGE